MLPLLSLLVSLAAPSAPQSGADALAHERTPFVANLGQWQHPAHFVARFGTSVVMLEQDGLRVGLDGHAIRLSFADACAAEPVAEERLAGSHGYRIGSDPARWRDEVPLYGRVRYPELWPGIDLLCHTRAGYLEYDLELQAGARLEAAHFEVAGASGLRLDSDGALVIETPAGPVHQPRPTTWSVRADGERRALAARFVLHGGTGFGFVAEGWDGREPLVIDPGLLYGTYYGSSGFNNLRGVALDASGLITVVGNCQAGDLPTTVGALDPSYNGNGDGFVARFDPTKSGGQQLVYATFLGGNGSDDAEDVVVTAGGLVVVTGATGSTNFPTTPGAFDRTFAGSLQDGYLVVLDPSLPAGQQLLYSTLIGGSGDEIMAEVMVDSAGVVTLAGWTDSLDFPFTVGAYDTQNDPGGDVLVVRIDPTKPTLQQLVYATLLGGTASDAGMAAALAPNGRVYLTGYTESLDFVTTPNAFDSSHNSPFTMDTFLAIVDPALAGSQQLVYSTFLGSNADDLSYSLALDGDAAVLAGVAMGEDFPLVRAFDTIFENVEGFVARLDPTLAPASQLTYSSFFGGEEFDFASAVAVDAAGVLTLAGDTYSTDFFVPPGAFKADSVGTSYGFLLRIDPSFLGLRQLVYGTLIGGDAGYQDLSDLAVDSNGFATVVGLTGSDDFPVTPGAFDPSFNLTADGFIAQFDLLPTGVTQYGDSSAGCEGPLTIGVSSWPKLGNTRFSLTCTGAPPASVGAVGIGLRRLTTPFLFQGARLWVDPAGPLVVRTASSNARGFCDVPWAVPNLASLAGIKVHAQFFWNGPTTPPSCPPLGGSASPALELRFQS